MAEGRVRVTTTALAREKIPEKEKRIQPVENSTRVNAGKRTEVDLATVAIEPKLIRNH